MAALFAPVETKPKSGSLNTIEPTQHHAIDMPITSDGTSQPPVSPNITQDGVSGGIPDESVGISSELISKFLKALEERNFEDVKVLVEEEKKLATYILNHFGETALHTAAYVGQTRIVEYLGTKVKPADLEIKNSSSDTALHFAARGGNVDIAKILVDKNKTLLNIKGAKGQFPVTMAAAYGNRDMVKYLYDESDIMNEDLWTPEDRGRLLLACVEAGLFDIATQIVIEIPELAKSPGHILEALVCNLDAFGIKKHYEENQAVRWLGTVMHWLRTVVANFRKPKIDACDGHVDEGNQAVLFLKTLLKQIKKLEETPQKYYISRTQFEAVEKGNTPFLSLLIKEYPQFLSEVNDKKQNLLQAAVFYRRAGIFNLLNSKSGSRRDYLKNAVDENGNNLLHFVGMLEQITNINHWQDLKEPGVQMEQEHIWFKMVSDILLPSLREKKNNDGLTPQELFTKNHKELFLKVVDSEKKTISGYFSPAVAILLAVAGAARFLRYHDETGLPLYPTILLHGTAFVLALTSVRNTWKIPVYHVHDFLSLHSMVKLTVNGMEMAFVLLFLTVAITYLIKDPYRTPIAVVILSFVYSKMHTLLFPRHLENRSKLA